MITKTIITIRTTIATCRLSGSIKAVPLPEITWLVTEVRLYRLLLSPKLNTLKSASAISALILGMTANIFSIGILKIFCITGGAGGGSPYFSWASSTLACRAHM